MYTKDRIQDVLKICLKHFTMGDSKTDKTEKEEFVNTVMLELDNSDNILISESKE
jgi:hypothetical protein